jgi:hypothetical protein
MRRVSTASAGGGRVLVGAGSLLASTKPAITAPSSPAKIREVKMSVCVFLLDIGLCLRDVGGFLTYTGLYGMIIYRQNWTVQFRYYASFER